MRNKIKTGNLIEMVVDMAEGNPGAVDVLTQIVKAEGELGMFTILNLDDMNIRGPQIWVGYQDYCEGDLAKFVAATKVRDEKMIAKINEKCSCSGEIAVQHGASYEHRPRW